MSVPEYDLCAEDHRTVLVLVKQIGEKISPKSFTRIYEKIRSVQYLKIRDSGLTRFIWFRYEKDYPSENNDWGDFQTHRKVLGLISIGKCGLEANVEELSTEHSILLEKYNNSVYDSRCFVFSTDSSSPSETNESIKYFLDDKTVSPDFTHSPLDNINNGVFKDYVEPVPKSHMENEDDINLFNLSSSPKSDVSETFSKEVISVSNFSDFSSLPNSLPTQSNASLETVKSNDSNYTTDSGLSSNDISYANSGPSSPVMDGKGDYPGSKKFIIPSTTNSMSTHCIVYSGTDNCDQLEHDVKEFVNSIFWILESKRMDRSFEKQEKIPLLTAPFEKKNFVGIDTDTKVYKKRCLGRMKKHIGDLALQAGLPLDAFSLYSASIEYLKSGQDWLWLAAAYEGQCAASHIIQFQAKDVPLKVFSAESFKMRIPKSKMGMLD